MEGAIVGVALNDALDAGSLDAPAKGQDVAGFGANDEVLIVDGAFYAAGLIRAFEVAGDRGAILLEVEVLR
jgi:hypothetical protein